MRLYRHRMDRHLQLLCQKPVDYPVPLQPRFAFEGLAHYFDAEVGFAFTVELRMMAVGCVVVAGVQVAFVDDFEALRAQRRLKFLFNI